MQPAAKTAATHRVSDDEQRKGDGGNHPKGVNGNPRTEEDGKQNENENNWNHVFLPTIVATMCRDGELNSRALRQTADCEEGSQSLHEAPPDDPRSV